MGERGHLPSPPVPLSGNVKNIFALVVMFFALVVTAKRSTDDLFVHYFHIMSSASIGSSSQTPTGALSLNLPTPGKNPSGAHVRLLAVVMGL